MAARIEDPLYRSGPYFRLSGDIRQPHLLHRCKPQRPDQK
jgi:hypothetical protein